MCTFAARKQFDSNMKQYALSEICDFIGQLIAMETETYWVRAEIASVSEKGGHCYLDLVEKAETGLLAAKLRATCWANVYTMLRPYFEQETGSRLQAGMQILVEIEINFHSVYGLSANILDIDPKYTVGDLARQRQETIARLQKDGVMDMNKALELPTIVRRIAVISAETAAGFGDFCHQLQSNYHFETTLFPAVMQGEHAAQSIIAALMQINEQMSKWENEKMGKYKNEKMEKCENPFDVVVIIRGGGATTDLTCFDDYNLCSHCAQFPLPVITGIGHTRDVSVLDMVAFRALKTPTAVAQFFIDGREQQALRIQELARRLKQTAERQIMIRRHRLELLAERIRMHSPERIYRMGYSLATVNGKVVRSAADLHSGDVLTTHLSDGSATSVIQ